MKPLPILTLNTFPEQEKLFRALYALGLTYNSVNDVGLSWERWIATLGRPDSYPAMCLTGMSSFGSYGKAEHAPNQTRVNSIGHFVQYVKMLQAEDKRVKAANWEKVANGSKAQDAVQQ